LLEGSADEAAADDTNSVCVHKMKEG
jgi:hypothetical protein